MKERLYLYDTTLRDGQQTQGVDFSYAEKVRIAEMLDGLGIDWIEGGWPGANPTDSGFFAAPPQTSARMTAFGMTKRAGRSAANDEVLAAVTNAGTGAVCLVGKTHDFHVEKALEISLEENLDSIRGSIAHLKSLGREALFDAEHFFDGYKANRAYALESIHAAHRSGADWIVLCDTNGGTLPTEIAEIVADVIASGIPGTALGIHCHNDCEAAVAGSLAAVEAGARQIQGTLNGLGERCGNASLTTLIPTLLLKEPYASRFEIGVSREALAGLVQVSRALDDILNRVPQRQAPFVGASAFAHKAGLHASAILRAGPESYEHIDPAAVGNERIVPMSNQAGLSNLKRRLAEIGLDAGREEMMRLLDVVKQREAAGYAYDSAQASFELLAREELALMPHFFDVERYRVISERRRNARGDLVIVSEAVVTVALPGQGAVTSFFQNDNPTDQEDAGPVNALSQALVQDLGPYQDAIKGWRLVDFKVRITNGGTEAVTRVILDSEDDTGRRWSTVGVSANIVDASFEALIDAIRWKLLRDHA